MQKILTVAAAIMMALTAAAAAPKALPAKYSGTMMPYDFTRTTATPAWPDSLKPVYVAHVARHGARYITSEKKLERLRKAIASARTAGSLTDSGKKFSALLDTVAARSEGRWGLLSDVGKREEQRIADSLYKLTSPLLERGDIRAISTYVPRVEMTMYEFCHQLTRHTSHLDISASSGREYSALLRCFSADSAYNAYRNDGDWQRIYDEAVDATISPGPALRILGKHSGMDDSDLKKTTMDIYDILQSLTAFGMDAPDTEFMTEQEYRSCWEADDLAHYLRNADSAYSSLPGAASSPLLAKILADADEALGALALSDALKKEGMHSGRTAPEPYVANLYFGHAETLMPLLSLMQVEGCHYESDDLSGLASAWRDYEIVPLGANIDIILLGSPSGKTYAALLHNGRFILPPANTRTPFCSLLAGWEEYRSYLYGRIRHALR